MILQHELEGSLRTLNEGVEVRFEVRFGRKLLVLIEQCLTGFHSFRGTQVGNNRSGNRKCEAGIVEQTGIIERALARDGLQSRLDMYVLAGGSGDQITYRF